MIGDNDGIYFRVLCKTIVVISDVVALGCADKSKCYTESNSRINLGAAVESFTLSAWRGHGLSRQMIASVQTWKLNRVM